MNEVKIVDTILKAAEKVALIDLEEVGRKARELKADCLNTVTRKFVNAINPHCPERTAKRIQATLDIAYLLRNLGGWNSEKQEKRFEEIAANLGCETSDVSLDAVGLNAKLAHLRGRVSEDDLLAEFINGVRSDCESFGGLLVPSRRAFALWIALGLADGEMPALYRKAVMLLRGEFKHSALLYGVLGGLPVYATASAVGGLGMGIVISIMGGLQGLKHKQTLDRYCPLISNEFLSQAETLIRKMGELESQLVKTEDSAKKEYIQQEYATVSQQLQELINPPLSDDEDDEEEDEEYHHERMEVKMTAKPTKPFKLSRPKELIGTTAHWWSVRYCFFTGKDGRTYRVTASLIGGGYLDLPPDGRGLIVEVRDDRGNVELECMQNAVQPMSYEESDALLKEIEEELGIQADSEEVKELERSYNLS